MKQAIWLESSSSPRDPSLKEARGCDPHLAGGEATVEAGVVPVPRAASHFVREVLLALFVVPLMAGWPALAHAEVFYLVCSIDAQHESTTLKVDTVAKTVDDKTADIDDKKIERIEQIGTTTIDRATGDITFGFDPPDGKHYELNGKCVKRESK